MTSVILVGEDSLLIQCGQILINKGFDIKLIISPAKKIQEWVLDTESSILQVLMNFIN